MNAPQRIRSQSYGECGADQSGLSGVLRVVGICHVRVGGVLIPMTYGIEL